MDSLKTLARIYSVTVDELVGNGPEPSAAKKELPPEQRYYFTAAGLRTIWMLIIGLLAAPVIGPDGFGAEGGTTVLLTLFFLSLDWLAVLLGLWLRRPAVWGLALFLELVNVGIGMGAVCLVSSSLYAGLIPVLTGSAMLAALSQRKARAYFGVIVPDDKKL